MPKSAILTLPRRVSEHVLGLEVAVGDAVALRVREPGEHALEHAEHLRQLERADQRPQRAAGDVLHRDVGHAVVLEEVEQRDDVRVVERGGEPRLATKRCASVGSSLSRSRRLSTTSRSSAGWRTRYTTAIPPRASMRTIS